MVYTLIKRLYVNSLSKDRRQNMQEKVQCNGTVVYWPSGTLASLSIPNTNNGATDTGNNWCCYSLGRARPTTRIPSECIAWCLSVLHDDHHSDFTPAITIVSC